MCQKLKDTFDDRPIPSITSHQTRPVGLVVLCEHWTPKGDCKVTGNKERNQKLSDQKKVHQKMEIYFNFIKKSLKKLFGTKTNQPENFYIKNSFKPE